MAEAKQPTDYITAYTLFGEGHNDYKTATFNFSKGFEPTDSLGTQTLALSFYIRHFAAKAVFVKDIVKNAVPQKHWLTAPEHTALYNAVTHDIVHAIISSVHFSTQSPTVFETFFAGAINTYVQNYFGALTDAQATLTKYTKKSQWHDLKNAPSCLTYTTSTALAHKKLCQHPRHAVLQSQLFTQMIEVYNQRQDATVQWIAPLPLDTSTVVQGLRQELSSVTASNSRARTNSYVDAVPSDPVGLVVIKKPTGFKAAQPSVEPVKPSPSTPRKVSFPADDQLCKVQEITPAEEEPAADAISATSSSAPFTTPQQVSIVPKRPAPKPPVRQGSGTLSTRPLPPETDVEPVTQTPSTPSASTSAPKGPLPAIPNIAPVESPVPPQENPRSRALPATPKAAPSAIDSRARTASLPMPTLPLPALPNTEPAALPVSPQNTAPNRALPATPKFAPVASDEARTRAASTGPKWSGVPAKKPATIPVAPPKQWTDKTAPSNTPPAAGY